MTNLSLSLHNQRLMAAWHATDTPSTNGELAQIWSLLPDDPAAAWGLLCPLLNQPHLITREVLVAALAVQQYLEDDHAIQGLTRLLGQQDMPALIAEWTAWLTGRGTFFLDSGFYRKAVSFWYSLSLIDGDNMLVWTGLATCYRRLEYWADERACLEKALEKAPEKADLWLQYGHVLQRFHDVTAALNAHQRAHALAPDDTEITSALEFTARRATDWPLIAALQPLDPAGELPFQCVFRYQDDARINPVIARWGQYFGQNRAILGKRIENPDPNRVIRIGYLSWDYFDHATMHLLGGLFRDHDRQHFHVTALSVGRPIEDSYRRAVEQDSDVFVDLYGLGDTALAQAIADQPLDILIDLKGLIGRLGHLAHRPAPIIASWLGFPGGTGADYIDYLIADHHVIPPDNRPLYPEAIAWMPVCYQLTDDRQPRPQPVSRATAFPGVPDTAVLMGSFCHSIKIDPDLWAAWLDILAATPQAFLVLLVPDSLDMVRQRLTETARAAGIDPDRLIFAPAVKKADHLNRLAHLDLCLDTWPCGGHTTTTDALWAGVPVLTRRGGHFAGRVAESLLHAVNLPDLIATDRNDYVRKAITLIGDSTALSHLRAHLKNPATLPLFNSRARLRDLEGLYRQMWQRACAGLSPADIEGLSDA